MNTPKLSMKTDAGLISTSVPTERIVEIEVTAPEHAGDVDQTPLNLALVIDRSGSMSDGKLEQAKAAAYHILDLLQPKDSLTIVDYDDQVSITADCESVTPSARLEMKAAVKNLQPRGMTNLGDGWLTGCEGAARRQAVYKVNRTLLLTDGLANVGVTDVEVLAHQASGVFARGIATSTFGIGEDFNEHLLEAMANRGGGNYYFIDNASRIPELLLKEFKELAAVTLKGVTLEFNFPSNVAVELLGEWRAEKSAKKLLINLSDLTANSSVTLFIKILAPAGSGQLVMNAALSGLDEKDQPFQVAEELSLQYASSEKVKTAEENRDRELLSRYSSVAVGQFANEALKLEREGKRAEAGALMDRLILQYGASLPSLTRNRYERIRGEVREGLDETRRKNYNQDTYLLKKHRHEDQKQDPGENK